jgi:hypothetical protein
MERPKITSGGAKYLFSSGPRLTLLGGTNLEVDPNAPSGLIGLMA